MHFILVPFDLMGKAQKGSLFVAEPLLGVGVGLSTDQYSCFVGLSSFCSCSQTIGSLGGKTWGEENICQNRSVYFMTKKKGSGGH